VRRLYILFDARCELCRQLKHWLETQPVLIELRFVAAGSEEARRLFPSIPAAAEELIVISDRGEVYSGNQGWIMGLWALAEYRDLAYKLSSPLLLPLARSAFAAISRHRREISEWLRGEDSEGEIAAGLSRVRQDNCLLPGAPPMSEEQP
jgi:predicted DCC family thiol-disulfide oxidoreductase YuxK